MYETRKQKMEIKSINTTCITLINPHQKSNFRVVIPRHLHVQTNRYNIVKIILLTVKIIENAVTE